MKIEYTLALLLFLPVCYAEENSGKVCLNIPEPGVETVKIEHNCKKGDIIQLNKLHAPNLCDFNSAISILMEKTNLSVFVWVKNAHYMLGIIDYPTINRNQT